MARAVKPGDQRVVGRHGRAIRPLGVHDLTGGQTNTSVTLSRDPVTRIGKGHATGDNKVGSGGLSPLAPTIANSQLEPLRDDRGGVGASERRLPEPSRVHALEQRLRNMFRSYT
jgi:hypothetical protein